MSHATQDMPVPDVVEHSVDDERALLCRRLHAAADFIAAHPEVNPHEVGCDYNGTVVIRDYTVHTADDLARVSRAIGGRWDKRDSETLFSLIREVADGITVELTAWRQDVCERVVTGTRTVEVEEPDPDAVAALPKVKRVETVEDVEWRCAPLLAEREPQAA